MATQRTAKTAAAAQKPPVANEQSSPNGSAVEASELVDYEGARQLLSRYCAHIDHGELVELSELFHRDAKFSVSFDNAGTHVGRDAILAWYTDFFRSRPGKVRHPRHKIFEPYLTLKGDTATASTYFDSDFVEPTGLVRVLAGRYDDVLVKERGRWFFAERTITICYNYSPGKGEEGMAP